VPRFHIKTHSIGQNDVLEKNDLPLTFFNVPHVVSIKDNIGVMLISLEEFILLNPYYFHQDAYILMKLNGTDSNMRVRTFLSGKVTRYKKHEAEGQT